jgi:hypothetical protein
MRCDAQPWLARRDRVADKQIGVPATLGYL